uniref:ATP synthase complex subunit 8 n=1 Tax=Thyropygus sp. DVL-2001 TaxID=174155 RepID=Q8WA89_9MYRI|nr:ATP synthase F0 subunit 8 [Thyropygus sp. DVL-2001]AAL18218.1 ATP synthase F0 subunit 8 [Thyropygus sp. DVL-2001]
MPQMFPMNWTTMFVFFIITYILVVILTNYIYMHRPISPTITLIKSNLAWKW